MQWYRLRNLINCSFWYRPYCEWRSGILTNRYKIWSKLGSIVNVNVWKTINAGELVNHYWILGSFWKSQRRTNWTYRYVKPVLKRDIGNKSDQFPFTKSSLHEKLYQSSQRIKFYPPGSYKTRVNPFKLYKDTFRDLGATEV